MIKTLKYLNRPSTLGLCGLKNKKLPSYYSIEYTFGSPAFLRQAQDLHLFGKHRNCGFPPLDYSGFGFVVLSFYMYLNSYQNYEVMSRTNIPHYTYSAGYL